jgi:hypothetical protein
LPKEEKAFLFDKLGKCGECGLSITREYHKKKSGKEFRYYRCSKKSRSHKYTQKAINEKDLALFRAKVFFFNGAPLSLGEINANKL